VYCFSFQHALDALYLGMLGAMLPRQSARPGHNRQTILRGLPTTYKTGTALTCLIQGVKRSDL